MGSSDDTGTVEKTVQLIVDYCNQPTATNKAALYESLLDEAVVAQIDDLIERLLDHQGRNDSRLHDLARSLVLDAPDRERVKLGIALLALFRNPEDLDIFLTIGRHDEFSLYAAVAIQNQENSERSHWELGKNVFGWGRIHVVERLSETTDPAIQDWLVRDGFRNEILYEYLAGLCARAGHLKEALKQDTVDRELLTAAGEIVTAWLLGGPVASITSYEEGVETVQLLLGHLNRSAATLGDLLAVSAVRSFLIGSSPKSEEAIAHGWSEGLCERLALQCDEIINRPDWPGRVTAALESEDDKTFYDADRCAAVLNIDTWEHHRQRLRLNFREPSRWYYVMRGAGMERVKQVVDMAEKYLPLEAIAIGPAEENGLGPEFGNDSCLDFVVQDLRKYKGVGSSLIEAALRSRVIRLRRVAIVTLEEWGRENWWTTAAEDLAAAAAAEPREDVREEIRRLLAGLPTQQSE